MTNAVEILVSWQGRILSSHGFSRPGRIYIGGGPDADVKVPTLPRWAKYELLELGTQTTLRVSPLDASAREVYMLSGETARVDFEGGLISLIIRNIARSPVMKMAPIFDLTPSEKAGIVLAFATTTFFGFYMNTLAPRLLPNAEENLEKRTARILFEKSTPQVKPVESVAKSEVSKPVSAPSRVVHHPVAARRNPQPKAGNILQTFSSSGLANQLRNAFSPENDLSKLAATNSHGPGEVAAQGSGLKEVKSGSDGKTVSVGNLGTSGRNGGGTGYVGGLGPKGRATITTEGAAADFSAGMDREAIRRVIREHLPEIRSCYERELQRDPSLYGKLVLEWDISEGGKVLRAVTKSNSLDSVAVPDCLLAHLKTWKFPDPPSNVIGRVSYPFIFSVH